MHSIQLKNDNVCLKGNNTKTCDPWTARDFEVQMAKVQRNSSKLCSHCLPDCDHIDYLWSTTSAEFRCQRLTPLTTLIPSIFFRRCDSRNLNLSPFCGLDSSSTLLKLQPTLEATYKDRMEASYVQDLQSPMRKEYPHSSMASYEILSVLTEVAILLQELLFIEFSLQDDPQYNAYKRDIAVVNFFFPDLTAFGLSALHLSTFYL